MNANHYRPGATQTVLVGATSVATTNAMGSGFRAARIVSTTDCHVKVDPSPTATTDDMFLPADTPEIIRVHPDDKVAFIQNAAGGTAYVTVFDQ